jgi:hypothetical protein
MAGTEISMRGRPFTPMLKMRPGGAGTQPLAGE